MNATERLTPAQRRSREQQVARLCVTGLSLEILLPDLFSRLDQLIPCSGRALFWLSPRGEVTRAYDNRPEASHCLPLFLSEFLGKPGQSEVMLDWTQSARRFAKTVDAWQLVHLEARQFYDTALYNEVLRPLNAWHGIHTTISDESGRQAVLMQNRGRGDQPFSTDDQRSMDRLMPFLAMAEQQNNSKAQWIESSLDENHATLLVDRNMQIQHQSHTAELLLLQLRDGYVANQKIDNAYAVIKQACQNLVSLYGNPSSDNLRTPRVVIDNRWGRFTVQAEFLSGEDAVILVRLSRLEQIHMRLSKALLQRDLTIRQHEAALLMATGLSDADIAANMGISKTTAISHVRAVCQQFDISNRAELPLLLLRDSLSSDSSAFTSIQ